MLIKKAADLRYSDITPKPIYFNRRQFLAGVPAAFLAARKMFAETKLPNLVKSPLSTTGEPVNTLEDVTHYNNYYEFGTRKNQPAVLAQKLKTSPWTVSIEGEVEKPLKLSMDDIMKVAPLEERIYRHRCVEAWSIVVPWAGYSLSELLKKASPTSKAKFVAFESLYDSKVMWSPEMAGIQLPYVEGLRLDEAMHPLALLCVGMYGETLPPQDGAPVRIVLPWKYGFKSIKSIVKIKLVTRAAAHHLEYRQCRRVWLLLQREPARRSSTLEPGHRAAAGRGPEKARHCGAHPPPHSDVQRIWRSGRESLRRHGSEEILLSRC